MLQANALRVGLLIGGALVIQLLGWSSPLVLPVPSLWRGGCRNGVVGLLVGWSRCWVLRERAWMPLLVGGFPVCVFRHVDSLSPGWWWWVWCAGRSGRHTASRSR